MNRQDCTFGFLLGLGAGAVIGLLLAPLSGVEARRLLVAKAQEGADLVKEQAGDLIDGVVRQQDGLKNAVEAGKKAYAYTTA